MMNTETLSSGMATDSNIIKLERGKKHRVYGAGVATPCRILCLRGSGEVSYYTRSEVWRRAKLHAGQAATVIGGPIDVVAGEDGSEFVCAIL